MRIFGINDIETLTLPNSVFAVRCAHPNAFGTSQTRRPLSEIAIQTDRLIIYLNHDDLFD